MPQPQRKKSGGEEFFYLDADGNKRDAELHEAILEDGDHAAAKRVSDKILARVRAKREKAKAGSEWLDSPDLLNSANGLYKGHEYDPDDRERRRAQEIAGRLDSARARDRRGRDGAASEIDGAGSHRSLQSWWDVDRLFDPSQARDEQGRWVDTGASYESENPSPAQQGENVASVYKLGRAGQTAALKAGITPLTFYGLTSDGSDKFHAAIMAAKGGKFGASVHAYGADEYRDMRIFLTPDSKVGFALKQNGDCVSAFKNESASDIAGAAESALTLAVQHGGTRLDAFDTVLPRIYSNAGFHAVARLAWSDEFAPPGWDKATYAKFNNGQPDVVFMVYDPDHKDRYKPGEGKRVTTYDEGIAAQDEALKALGRTKDFDESKHPRVPAGSPEGGQFGEGGGGSDADEGAGGSIKLDPKVIEVGGDEWNQGVARRLEREYQEARPKLEKLTDEGPGKVKSEKIAAEEAATEEIEEGEPPYVPEEWAGLSNDAQSDAEQKYISHNLDSYYDSELESWHEGGTPLEDAKETLVNDFAVAQKNNTSLDDWIVDVVSDIREARVLDEEPTIPYTDEQILGAVTISYSSKYQDGKGDLKVLFDNDKLQEPSDRPPPPDPAQLLLPGVEPPPLQDYSQHLNSDMREQLENEIEKAFDKAAEKTASDMEPPEYLKESAEEYAGESWSQMDDGDKFAWVQSNTNIIEDESTAGTGSYADKEPEPKEENPLDALPTKYDPLNETSGRDYKRTQALAKYLSVNRAFEVLTERGITPKILEQGGGTEVGLKSRIEVTDNKLWRSWVASSTTADGKLLQVATAEELGGRLNPNTASGIDVDTLRTYAEQNYKSIGGYDGVKAYIRAKWETTQYLLDKANTADLNLYRGINMKKHDPERFDQAVREKAAKQLVTVDRPEYKGAQFQKAPTIKVDRNGAASTTTDFKVANGWSQKEGRIVLRAHVPRTAVISVPAYGVNEQSEHEVVVAGTAWKSWDAWIETAPTFEQVPMGAYGTGIGTNAPRLAA